MKCIENLIGKLNVMKLMNIKPNFSELERQYGMNRHTIKKYYNDGGIVRKEYKKRPCKNDWLSDEIIDIMKDPAVKISALYQYLCAKYPDEDINYNTLKSHIHRLGIYRGKKYIKPHVRYETGPGVQLQFDWKEDLEMVSMNGEIFKFNIFSATLGYSRLHLFIYTTGKTTEDLLRCLIEAINRIGGIPNYCITDNMSAIVMIRNGHKKKHEIIKQFERDLDMKIKLCEVRTPETKGKVENSNLFMDWLKPYNNRFTDENDLINIIDRISIQCNSQKNQTTNIPPYVLFNQKEKEYLRPIKSKILLESYIQDVKTQIVPSTLLVNYKGQSYSVSSEYIGKRVKIVPISNKLYIYFNTKLITTHNISTKKINYLDDHYYDGISKVIRNKTDDEIERIVKENLALLDKIGNRNE